MSILKAFLLLVFTFSAYAEYRFTGLHPYKLTMNDENDVIATLCYNDFKKCTGTISIGSFKDLSLVIQKNIWRRSDVNTENYKAVLKESETVLKNAMTELEKRKKTVKELSQNDPKIAESLTDYITKATIKVNDSVYAIERLKEGKILADEVILRVRKTLKGEISSTFPETFNYNFQDFEWNVCRKLKTEGECFERGIQYYLEDKNNNYREKLLSKAMKNENSKNGFPQMTSTGLRVSLLSTNASRFGRIDLTQQAEAIPTKVGGERYDLCLAQDTTGTLFQSELSCKILGKNWRYPKLTELQNNREDLLRILPKINDQRFLQTSEAKGFPNPGNVNLTECHPVLLNLNLNKTMNNQIELVRSFSRGKEPKGGISAICVCSKDC
jgi:hypothetical protein